jgi:hypothetical protein
MSQSNLVHTCVVPGALVKVLGGVSVTTAWGTMFQAAALYAFCAKVTASPTVA